jgi:hypothetical protein
MARNYIRRFSAPASGALSALLFLFLSAAHAQTSPPPEEAPASPMGAIIFGILFVLFCLGFVWMVWRGDKTKKDGTNAKPE